MSRLLCLGAVTDVHRYGLIPDVHDERDFRFSALRLHVPVLPPSLDHRPYAPAIKDQGNEGACTAFGATRANRTAHALAGRPIADLSEQWLYWQERWLEHAVLEDVGAMPRDALRVLRKVGCDTEANYPYVPGQFAAHPPEDLVAAAPARIKGFYRCRTVLDMKTALVAKHGLILGFRVPESFESVAVARTGIVSLPAMRNGRIVESFLGGHCTTIEGFNDGGLAGVPDHSMIAANSWSEGWADRGFFYLPYDWFDPTLPLVTDIWALVV